ncbi:unnamed protein product [Linum trigynum]|uniref:Uncharacterized protein n=1 Tax=Linum trigynum TaxID=586398 RepID=A0AAV2GGS8_9ROSI
MFIPILSKHPTHHHKPGRVDHLALTRYVVESPTHQVSLERGGVRFRPQKLGPGLPCIRTIPDDMKCRLPFSTTNRAHIRGCKVPMSPFSIREKPSMRHKPEKCTNMLGSRYTPNCTPKRMRTTWLFLFSSQGVDCFEGEAPIWAKPPNWYVMLIFLGHRVQLNLHYHLRR